MQTLASRDATAATVVREQWADLVTNAGHDLSTPLGVGAAATALLEVMPPLALPGTGRTWERFEALAAMGAADLSVARILEAHFDAEAILHELHAADLAQPGRLWGVWAAQPPTARVEARRGAGESWSLAGTKAWCSGATVCSHALVTATAADGPRLFAVALADPAVRPGPDEWASAALAAADTRAVEFRDASARAIGRAQHYVARPGFWHGAVGVAAVWYGGALGVGRRLLEAGRRGDIGDIGRAHLGGVGASLAAARAALRDAATAIDDDPQDASGCAAIRARETRAVVEASALEVIDRVGRALGPGPLASEPEHQQRVADLTLYLRQSHAERDLADLGERLISSPLTW